MARRITKWIRTHSVGIMLLFAAVFIGISAWNVASAAGVIDFGSIGVSDVGSGAERIDTLDAIDGATKFNTQLKEFSVGFHEAARIITVIMTVTAGAMVAFGLQDGKKMIWQALLGLGLALNFGDFVWTMWGDQANYAFKEAENVKWGSDTTPEELTKIHDVGDGDNKASGESIKNSGQGEGFNFLGNFMKYYHDQVILPGMVAIIPAAIKLTLVFAVLNGGVKLALDLAGGDKIKFMTLTILKVGFYIYLIEYWIPISDAVGNGFEQLGYMAGGGSEVTVTSDDAQTKRLACNSIINNVAVMIGTLWSQLDFSLGSMLVSLVGLLGVVFIFICGLFIAMEMFMARVELYTMALLSIPLLAFGVLDPLKSFAEKAWAGMLNLSVKLMTIAFIESFAVKIFSNVTENYIATSTTGIVSIFQVIIVAVIVLFITKKIPNLVQSLLSGSPALNGSDMKALAVDAAKGAAKVASGAGATVGAMQAASAAAGGNWTGGGVKGFAGHTLGTAGQLAKAGFMAAATKNPVTKGYQSMVNSLANDKTGLLSKDKEGKSNAWQIGNTEKSAGDMLEDLRKQPKTEKTSSEKMTTVKKPFTPSKK